MNSVCRAVFCCEARELSYLFFLFYCKASGGLLVLLAAGPGGAQQVLFRGGLHQAAAGLAEGLGDRIRLESPVASVQQDDDRVVVTTTSGEEVVAQRAVVALPPPLAAEIDWTPQLPQSRRRRSSGRRWGRRSRPGSPTPSPSGAAEGSTGSSPTTSRRSTPSST
jgi:monoamine oxidase